MGLFATASMRVRLLAQDFEFSSGAGEVQAAYDPGRIAGIFSFGPSYEF